jgi:hypothetical protein
VYRVVSFLCPVVYLTFLMYCCQSVAYFLFESDIRELFGGL